MGLEVYCFSWKDGAVCADVADHFFPISIIEKESILKECQTAGIDGITTIASDTAVLTVNYVAGKMGLISNSDEYSQTTTNKFLMRRCFEAHNVPSPKYVKIAAEREAVAWKRFTVPNTFPPQWRGRKKNLSPTRPLWRNT